MRHSRMWYTQHSTSTMSMCCIRICTLWMDGWIFTRRRTQTRYSGSTERHYKGSLWSKMYLATIVRANGTVCTSIANSACSACLGGQFKFLAGIDNTSYLVTTCMPTLSFKSKPVAGNGTRENGLAGEIKSRTHAAFHAEIAKLLIDRRAMHWWLSQEKPKFRRTVITVWNKWFISFVWQQVSWYNRLEWK